MAGQGISCEVIDLRTIVPLDVEAIVESVTKTGRLLVVDEAYAMCGVGAEIAAAVMEHAFDELDAPVGRLHTDPASHPFSPVLEDAIVTSVEKIVAAARSVIAGCPPIPHRAVGSGGRRQGSGAGGGGSGGGGSGGGTSLSAAKGVEGGTSLSAAKGVEGGTSLKRSEGRGRRGPKPQARTQSPKPARGVPVNMPNMDLIITEATVVAWLKKIGDAVHKGEPLLEIETDKAVTNVESPADGVLVEILAEAARSSRWGNNRGPSRHEDQSALSGLSPRPPGDAPPGHRHWPRPRHGSERPHPRGRRAAPPPRGRDQGSGGRGQGSGIRGRRPGGRGQARRRRRGLGSQTPLSHGERGRGS